MGVARLISSASSNCAKIGPCRKVELHRLRIENRNAGHIPGQQVRCELDAFERRADAPRDGLGQHGLADPGHILDQNMTAAEQGNNNQLDFAALADDDVLDIASNAGRKILNPLCLHYGNVPALPKFELPSGSITMTVYEQMT